MRPRSRSSTPSAIRARFWSGWLINLKWTGRRPDMFFCLTDQAISAGRRTFSAAKECPDRLHVWIGPVDPATPSLRVVPALHGGGSELP
jgi:hypothetical protein